MATIAHASWRSPALRSAAAGTVHPANLSPAHGRRSAPQPLRFDFAWQRNARCMFNLFCMGFFSGFCAPSPLGRRGDVSDDRLAGLGDVDVLDRSLLLPFERYSFSADIRAANFRVSFLNPLRAVFLWDVIDMGEATCDVMLAICTAVICAEIIRVIARLNSLDDASMKFVPFSKSRFSLLASTS